MLKYFAYRFAFTLSEEVNIQSHCAHEKINVFTLLDSELGREDPAGLDVLKNTVPITC